MALRPLYLKVAPTTVRAPFGLLETFPPQSMPPHGALAGIEYDTEFCGVAQPWDASACLAPNIGTISVSVSNARLATITGTGEPAGTGYTVDWGAGTPDVDVALDGQTNTYASNGNYTVSVTGDNGYTASVDITVTNGSTSGPFVATAVATKVPTDGFDQTTGVPIIIYHLFTCRLVGDSNLTPQQRAERSLEGGASRAVEEGFGDVIGDDAVDITPSGTAVSAVKGLALLEQYGGANYGGQRVIHADNATVTRLISQNLIVNANGHLETLLGSIVVSGPGYAESTGPSAPAAGARWMYATGAVNIWKQKVDVSEMQIDVPYTNEFKALAEQIYVPTYECFAAAAEVTLEA